MTWAILNPDIHAAVMEMTKTRRDRVIAVVGGAIVEEALLRALEMRMRPPSKPTKPSFAMKKLFSPSRAVGAFGAKIDLGYALQMYDADVLNALEGISGIRNVFAHNLTITSFASANKALQDAFAKLKLQSKFSKYPAPFWNGLTSDPVLLPKTKRALFTTNMRIILLLLMRDLRTHLQYSNVPTPLPAAPAQVPATRKKKR